MAEYPFEKLLLSQQGDTSVEGFGTQIGNCPDGFQPRLAAGYEGPVLALGMHKHLTSDNLTALYESKDISIAASLRAVGAVVGVPHTEDKDPAWLAALAPDLIEIYNIHANVDPKIRALSLGQAPFIPTTQLASYLLDPYSTLVPEMSFLGFLEIAPIYYTQWRKLLLAGIKVGIISGTDSHENIFKQIMNDGERLDSHRRMMRLTTSHVLAPDISITSVQAALTAHRSYVVFEGLGTPIGFDFFASTNQNTFSAGTSLSYAPNIIITMVAPTLHSASPKGPPPSISLKLYRIDATEDTLVASGSSIVWSVSSAGIYRGEVTIIPSHLAPWLTDFAYLAKQTFTWILTNPIFIQ